ncbi:MAG TPA: diacylglycerol kinase family protein [Blastocatellia bacterium]|nr:diacylglycerol kinase family protein [Blastocatellia bacterium]
MRVTLIHNPTAGDEDHSRDHLLSLMRGADYEVVYRTSKEDFAGALDDPGDLVAVAGGDGTVRETAIQILDRRVPIALLPMGTANNIARSLGIRGTTEDLIAGWATALRKKVTVGVAKSPWGEEHFIEGLGLGLFTKAMSLLDSIDDKAESEFSTTTDKVYRDLSALMVLLSECAPINLEVSVDGEEVSGSYLLLEAMNMNFVGPNLHIAPEADPGDEYLDYVFLAEEDRGDFIHYLNQRLEGKEAVPAVTMKRGRRLLFYWEGSEIHVDDKIWTDGVAAPSSPQLVNVGLEDRFVEFLVPSGKA